MPLLLDGNCCLCPGGLGADNCQNSKTGIEQAYYICPSQIETITWAADTNGCDDEAEILSFTLKATVPVESGLLQPIIFVDQDDDTGFLHEFDDTEDAGNTTLNHTVTFQVRSESPDQEAIAYSMLSRKIAFLVKYKSGRWKFISYDGSLRVKNVQGNSNQSYKVMIASGRLNSRPKFVSSTDDGAWADTALVPYSADPINGLINL